MPRIVNTYVQLLPPKDGTGGVVVKNECYFSLVFLGGSYLSYGNILQTIFGGRSDVALIAGLRLQPDGLVITNVEEPNVVLDKRSIKPGRLTNIPLVLNVLTKIPAYMNTIGFSFKIATTKRSDNFSVALDVLNDSANKSVLEGLAPMVVGKALGIGKVVRDLFEKLDAANDNSLIQLVVNDFIIPAAATTTGPNNLQEGYLVIFVKNEQEAEDTFVEAARGNSQPPAAVALDDGFGNERLVQPEETTFVDISQLETSSAFARSLEASPANAGQLTYDEVKKELRYNGKVVANTHLVFKVQKETEQGENLNAGWSKRFVQAVDTLANEFIKTPQRLAELQPKVTQLLNEAMGLLSEDTGYIRSEKESIKERYRRLVQAEQAKYTA